MILHRKCRSRRRPNGHVPYPPFTRNMPMKVMVFVKATPNSEKGLPPAEVMQAMFEKMGAFNEKLSKAGIMKDGDGLKPSKFGKRIAFKAGGKRSVIDGPFAETKEIGRASCRERV